MLKQRLLDDQITALKSGDKTKLELMRYILAQLHNKEIEKQAELGDEDVIDGLKKIAKELGESIDAFKKGGARIWWNKTKNSLRFSKNIFPRKLAMNNLKRNSKNSLTKTKTIFKKTQKR